jgi:hypothetical protein
MKQGGTDAARCVDSQQMLDQTLRVDALDEEVRRARLRLASDSENAEWHRSWRAKSL